MIRVELEAAQGPRNSFKSGSQTAWHRKSHLRVINDAMWLLNMSKKTRIGICSRACQPLGLQISQLPAWRSPDANSGPCSARVYPLEALMADCRAYFGATGRRVTFEYTLMAGVNDSPHHVRAFTLPGAELSLVCILQPWL